MQVVRREAAAAFLEFPGGRAARLLARVHVCLMRHPSALGQIAACAGEDLTFDHVTPRSRGGRTTWENIVTACARCNLAKGGRTPAEAHMQPRQKPRRPSAHELQDRGRRFPPHHLHESWLDYLYWDIELEA